MPFVAVLPFTVVVRVRKLLLSLLLSARWLCYSILISLGSVSIPKQGRIHANIQCEHRFQPLGIFCSYMTQRGNCLPPTYFHHVHGSDGRNPRIILILLCIVLRGALDPATPSCWETILIGLPSTYGTLGT